MKRRKQADSMASPKPAAPSLPSSPPHAPPSTWSPWPSFAEDEIEAVERVMRSGKVNYWTGNECRQFEEELAASVECKHAVAVANGTVALELALHAIGIEPDDEVIVTPRSFIASASSVVMRRGRPVFAEVDAQSQNITLESIARVTTRRTRAIVAVHLAGWPCDMDAIMEFSRPRGIKVVEDCAQAQGATYRGRPVGSLGDIAAFSFCQDKIMTTGGEGGMVTTNDQGLWSRAWSFKDHGKSFNAYQAESGSAYRWLHESFGTNWRLTEIQGAIGRLQLKKLPQWLEIRRANAARLRSALCDLPSLRIPVPPASVEHAYYKFYAFIEPEALREGWNRDRLLQAISSRGVPCFMGSCGEIYLESAFPSDLRPKDRLPIARRLGETSLMLQVHPTLTSAEIDRMGLAVREALLLATRPELLKSTEDAA